MSNLRVSLGVSAGAMVVTLALFDWQMTGRFWAMYFFVMLFNLLGYLEGQWTAEHQEHR